MHSKSGKFLAVFVLMLTLIAAPAHATQKPKENIYTSIFKEIIDSVKSLF
jgi:hypothetical protein